MRTLEITTYVGCPNMCEYCPQKTLIDAYKGDKTMSVETFKRILENVPEDVEIHFSGFSELFFHPDAIDFIEEASKKHAMVMYTTTKGMSKLQEAQLKKYKFKQFVIHQRPGTRDLDIKDYTAVIDDSNKISRAGHLYSVGKERRGECKRSKYYEQNVVLPNGDVYLCCMDYGLEGYVGNLLKTHYNDLDRKSEYPLCHKCEMYE